MDVFSWLSAIVATILSTLPATQWSARLDTLDSRRDDAFVRQDPTRLADVYRVGSALLVADRRAIASYRARGLRPDHVSLRLLDVEVVARGRDRVRLRVVDQLEQVRVRRAGGPWRSLPRDGPTERILTLIHTPDGWRIEGDRRVAG